MNNIRLLKRMFVALRRANASKTWLSTSSLLMGKQYKSFKELRTILNNSKSSEEVFRSFTQFYKAAGANDAVQVVVKLTDLTPPGNNMALLADERFDKLKNYISEKIDLFSPIQQSLIFLRFLQVGVDINDELMIEILRKMSETGQLLSLRRLVLVIHELHKHSDQEPTPTLKSLKLRFYQQLADKLTWEAEAVEALDQNYLEMLAAISEPLRVKIKDKL